MVIIMTTEEKARAYDEALEKARIFKEHLIEISQKGFADEMEYIFPELKESEDEKIRKALIDGFTVMKESKNCGKTFSNYNIPVVDIIAWLEKQGEQKPYGKRQECVDCQFNYAGECKGYCTMKKDEQKSADKVEPKFKLEHGKWYRCILTPVVHKYFTVGKVYKCELEGCLVDDINEDRIVDLDLECFRPATEDEIPQEKSEAEMVKANETNSKYQNVVMQMLQSIYEVLVSINNKTPMQVIPYTPQPLTPYYDTSKPYCTSNKIDDERPETTM